LGSRREAHFHPVARRDGHPQSAYIFALTFAPGISSAGALGVALASAGQFQVGGAQHHIHQHILVGLVLQHHRQLKDVAEVQEARGGWAHHQGQAGGQAVFGRAEAGAGTVHRHSHDAVAGQVIRQYHRHAGSAVFICSNLRGKDRQRVKVCAQGDGGLAAVRGRCSRGGHGGHHGGHGRCFFSSRHFHCLFGYIAHPLVSCQRQRVRQHDAGAPVDAIEICLPPGIEDAQGIGQLVVCQCQHGFIDHHQGNLSLRDRFTGCIFHHQVDSGLAAWFKFLLLWVRLHFQGAFEGWDIQAEAASGVGRAFWRFQQRFALVIAAQRCAHQVHLDFQVGDVSFFDGDAQGDRAVLNHKALVVQHTAAADGEQPFGGAKGGLHQDFGGVAGLVGFFIRDQGDALLFHFARRRALSAAHPAGDAGLVLPAQPIRDGGGDAVGAPHRGLESAGYRL